MRPGVYRLAGTVDDREQRAMAAVLASGSGALASHRMAGELYGFPQMPRWHEVTVPAARHIKVEGVIVHRSRLVIPEDAAQAKLIPATSALRTVFDLAGLYAKPRFAKMFDYGLSHKLYTRGEVEARLEFLRARRLDVPLIVELLEERPVSGRPMGSDLESDLFAALDAGGVERPVPQYKVTLPDGSVVYIDFAYPKVKLGLEAEGYIWHGHRTAWEKDRTRDHEVMALGWALIPITWGLVTSNPRKVADLVRRALAARN